jgi:hypothetical protein
MLTPSNWSEELVLSWLMRRRVVWRFDRVIFNSFEVIGGVKVKGTGKILRNLILNPLTNIEGNHIKVLNTSARFMEKVPNT